MDDKRRMGEDKPPSYAHVDAYGEPAAPREVRYAPSSNPSMPPPFPQSKTEYPQSQTGYPQPQTGYPQPQTGYPQPQTGYPQLQPGIYPQSQPYPQPQPGNPQSQPGYPQSVSPQPPLFLSNRPRGYYDQAANNDTVWGPRTATVTSGGRSFLLGPTPISLTCPSCNHQVVTDAKPSPDMRTHLFAFILCILCPCVLWLPYCIDDCQGKKHYCPECGCFIGTYRNY